MIHYVIYKLATGEITGVRKCTAEDAVLVNIEGYGLLETELPIVPSHVNLVTLELEAGAIDSRLLTLVQATRRLYVNDERLKANQSYFIFEGKQISVDPLSRGDIDATHGEVLMNGAFAANWPGGWKTIDNSYVAIPDVATWKLFYSAMVAQGSANFLHAQDLKATIDAATTILDVEAVVW